jgi:HPt (histidine-containing phosphotransfer) domain-containing protein
MKEIVPQFLKNALEDVDALRAALEHHDFQAIARLGHSMKGAGGFGFDFLNQTGRYLEDAARIKALRQIVSLVGELEDYLHRVEPVYGPV